jgi:hypothetical protein
VILRVNRTLNVRVCIIQLLINGNCLKLVKHQLVVLVVGWVFLGWVRITMHEVLQKKLTVLEIARVMLIGLSVDSRDSLLEVLTPPDISFYV